MKDRSFGLSCSGIVLIAVLVGIMSAPATAQTVTGSIEGHVTDQTGALVAGATVSVRNTETGQERTMTTNSEGYYRASFLPIGPYRVAASFTGFASLVYEKVQITLNQTTVTDFSLRPATASAEVTVTDIVAPINLTDAQVKQSLTSQEIIDKPTLNPGNFLTLAETFTGFQENPTSGQNNPTLSSGSSINFNGTGSRGATFQINGVNNDDSSENQNRQGVSLSTIKEFQVITNNFTAEFGRGYGAVVLVQTKSGTNKIHGDVYEFHQDSALKAKSFFTPGTVKKPVDRRNEYGFTVGLPIIKDRFFWFGSFDQTRESGGLSYTRDLLLPNERTPRLEPVNDTPANRAFIQSVIARFPANLVPNDPRSPRTYVGAQNRNFPASDYSGRIDLRLRDSDLVSVRYQYSRQRFGADEIIVGEETEQNNRQQNIGLTYTHIISPRFVGEFRYGLGLRNTLVGIKAGNDTPIVQFTGTPVMTAIIGNAGSYPINRYQTDHQLVYNINALFGTQHSFKAGTDIRRQALDDFADNFSRGFWTFNRICAGTTLATAYDQFLRGCIATFTKGYGPFFLENRINESNFYAEDSWKLRPNLTFTVGLRYEFVSAPRELQKKINYGFGDDKDNLQPRVGFAYSPGWRNGLIARLTGGPGNTSIRGGYGIYHGRLFQSVFSQGGAQVRFNPPNALLRAFTNSLNVADPTDGFVFVPGPQTARHSESLVDPDLGMPYTQQWSLTVERELPFSSTLRVTYNGNRGIGLLRLVQGNLPISPLAGGIVVVNDPNNAPAAGFPDLRGVLINKIAADFECAGTGLPGIPVTATCPVAVPIANNEVSVRVPRTNERRPDPRFTTLTFVSNGSWSYYNGLQIEWDKKFSRGLSFQMAYTLSKAIDTTSEATFVGTGDSNFTGPNTTAARALSRFDTRNRFTFLSSYLLPFFREGNPILKQALGGWQISSVVKLASGNPFTITGNALDLNFDGFAERPILVDPSVLYRSIDDPNTSQQRLPAAAFRRATFADIGQGGVTGRNTFFMDGVQNVDLGIYKNFAMPFEGHQLTFRAEFFNAFNHVQFGFPTTDTTSATFARITGTATSYSPRVIQLAMRYSF